jgi:multidrug efflux pump
MDQVNVQNRVAQAASQLPSNVNQYGVTIRKSFGSPMMLVSPYSPNNSYDKNSSRLRRGKFYR